VSKDLCEPVDLWGAMLYGRWFGVIVEHEEGIQYANQCGCIQCLQAKTTGVLYPIPAKLKPSYDLCYAGNFGTIDYEPERIQQVLESAPGETLTSKFEPANPDDHRGAYEAFVPVRVRKDATYMPDWTLGRDAVLVWNNCD